jgi:DNA-binding beta-propeller fold protein YncE
VWVANEDNDSVSRIDTATDAVTEFPLLGGRAGHGPRGLSVKDDGSEVLAGCPSNPRQGIDLAIKV